MWKSLRGISEDNGEYETRNDSGWVFPHNAFASFRSNTFSATNLHGNITMTEETDPGFEAGVEFNHRLPGVEWVFKRDDGSCIKGWAPTVEQAKADMKQELVV